MSNDAKLMTSTENKILRTIESSKLLQQLNVSRSTLYRWEKKFSRWLNDFRITKGRTRLYTEQDAFVYETIHNLRQAGKSLDQIQKELEDLLNKTELVSKTKQKEWFRRVIDTYSKPTMIVFLKRLHQTKPDYPIANYSLNHHIKEIMLYGILPRLRTANKHSSNLSWPPENIFLIIEEEVKQYVRKMTR